MGRTLRSDTPSSESDKIAPSVAAIHRSQSDLLSSNEAASYLGVQAGTLEVWRCTKRVRIPFLKVGRLVKYRLRDLDAWLVSRTVDAQAA